MVIKPSLPSRRGRRGYYPVLPGTERRALEISPFEHRLGRGAIIALCVFGLVWLGLQLGIPTEGIVSAMALFGEALRP